MSTRHRTHQGERSVSGWLAALFTSIVILSGVRFYLLRYYLDFTDENDHTTIGWLLTQGETLYGSIFAHHMPLPYLAAHVVAAISPTDRPAHFRCVPWIVYLAVALALARSPLARPHRNAGLLAASAFLVLASVCLPPFFGQMLLMDNLEGAFVAVFLVLVVVPVLAGVPPNSADIVAGGVGLGLAVAASPFAIFPAGIGLAGMAAIAMLQKPRDRSVFRPFLLLGSGCATSLLVVGIWLFRYGSIGGFIQEVMAFNRNVYGIYAYGQTGTTTAGILKVTFWQWLCLLNGTASLKVLNYRIVLAFLIVALAAAAAAGRLAWLQAATLHSRAGLRKGLLASASLLGIFILSAPRGFDFRALPFFILAIAVASLLGGVSLARSRSLKVAAFAIVVIAPLVDLALKDPSNQLDIAASVSWPAEVTPIADYIRARTSPADRIAVFCASPRLYLEAHRRPAAGTVIFLPWQARWEESRPFEKSTCAQLRRARPRFVVMNPETIWNFFRWEDYASCIDRFVKENYTKLPDERFGGLLWERSDVAAEERSKAGPPRPGTAPQAAPGTE